jgi:hypothetical protein
MTIAVQMRLTSRNGKNRTLRPLQESFDEKKTLQNSITARFTAKRVLEDQLLFDGG